MSAQENYTKSETTRNILRTASDNIFHDRYTPHPEYQAPILNESQIFNYSNYSALMAITDLINIVPPVIQNSIVATKSRKINLRCASDCLPSVD